MFLISQVFIQVLIIVGVVVLFLGSYLLNRKVKPPKGVNIPEKCGSCLSNTCMIKSSDVEKRKEDLRKYLEDCDKDETSETK